MIGKESINSLLHALDRNIEFYKGQPISLVVCGGTALFVLDLVQRTTRDVDVLGEIKCNQGKERVKSVKQFPPWFIKAAETVARDFNLPQDWINLGPASQVDSGLPDGLIGRLSKIEYGKFLTVFYISRIDQIFFKLYAALDRGGYHVDDLFALGPTGEEMRAAAKWVLTQDVSVSFRKILEDFLKKHGLSGIAHGL